MKKIFYEENIYKVIEKSRNYCIVMYLMDNIVYVHKL